MSSRNSSQNLMLQAATVLIGGLIITGLGLFAHKKWSGREKKFKVVFVLGGPGAGKGSVSADVMKDFGYVHLSAGDLLRAEREKGTALADMISAAIREGNIVPSDITVSLLRAEMERRLQEHASNKFIIDGFPRDMDNLCCWRKEMDSLAEVQFLLFLDCPNDVMISRLLNRKDGGRNDNLESICKRMSVYEHVTRPLIDLFRAEGKVREVDANRPLPEVLQEVHLHFNSINAHFDAQ